MVSTLEDLVKAARSPSLETQSQAVFQLAMLLEKSTRPSNEVGFYESVLSADLQDLTLGRKQQKEILERFLAIKELHGLMPSLLWAIGKGMPEAGLPLLLRLLREHSELLNPEAAYQAIIALDNLLHSRGTGGVRAANSTLHDSYVRDFLRRSASAADPKLSEHAKRLLKRLRK